MLRGQRPPQQHERRELQILGQHARCELAPRVRDEQVGLARAVEAQLIANGGDDCLPRSATPVRRRVCRAGVARGLREGIAGTHSPLAPSWWGREMDTLPAVDRIELPPNSRTPTAIAWVRIGETV
jgi:hypothetical protein